ncbi:MAG TPA: hypothetical protein VED47_10255 [Burkholderiaceae bacterium]|nr:hypothetical protein [Burkholderiaceae bacterium]
MITFTRTLTSTADKFPAAMAFAHEIAGYLKSKVGVDVKVQVAPCGGNPWRVRWVAQYENLAAYEQIGQKLMSDHKYMELAGKGTSQGLFIAGTTFDEVWLDA